MHPLFEPYRPQLDAHPWFGAVDASGKEALLTVAEPMTWFGEIALFDELPRTHDAIALEDALLMHVPQAALQQLLDETPRYWRYLALLMAQKLRMSFMNVEALTLMPAAQRLAARLLMIAEGYGGISTRHRRIRLSQERLGAMLSLSRQTANQLLKELAARGVVRLHVGEIEIVDLNALRAASGAAHRAEDDLAGAGDARSDGDAHGAGDASRAHATRRRS